MSEHQTIEQQTTEGYHCPRCGKHVPRYGHTCEPLTSNPSDDVARIQEVIIENLRAERDRLNEHARQLSKEHHDALDREDRLTRENKEALLQLSDRVSEARRLRAALEQIAHADNESFLGCRESRWIELREIAREALAGAADETETMPS